MSKYQSMVVCENNTVVGSIDDAVWDEWSQPALAVRVEIDADTGDCEMVSVAELAELYRKHKLNM